MANGTNPSALTTDYPKSPRIEFDGSVTHKDISNRGIIICLKKSWYCISTMAYPCT